MLKSVFSENTASASRVDQNRGRLGTAKKGAGYSGSSSVGW